MEKKLLDFFGGDELAANVWLSKYRFENEVLPTDMFNRLVKEIAEKEKQRIFGDNFEQIFKQKSHLLTAQGRNRYINLLTAVNIEEHFKKYISFDNITLGGSMMQGIGNHGIFSSLSNCFVLGQPYDSYAGINKKGDEIVQVMKRRGGAGLDLSTIRPKGTKVNNQARYSSGPVLFAEGYSLKTKEVAQDGRRGALMLSLMIRHPDALDFILSKQDLEKITGANISVGIDDDFMRAVESDGDYLMCFPVDADIEPLVQNKEFLAGLKYDELIKFDSAIHPDYRNAPKSIKKIRAKECWDILVRCAWKTAEPGILFIGNWEKYGYDWAYEQFRPVTTNPCSEIPMQPYDACRLLATNMYTFVKNPFTKDAHLDLNFIYDIFYEQLVIGDLLVDLELDYIGRIIDKIKSSDDPEDLKNPEMQLWERIAATAKSGRRCGAGFTGLGDMLAALNLPYNSPEVIDQVFSIKFKAELDAVTDLAILFGAFEGFNPDAYVPEVLSIEFPEEYERMRKYGRRMVSWSTGAPTGSTSICTQTTSGIEPLFMPFYKRRKKCILPTDRVDYIDPADKQKFSEYLVLHPKFELWISLKYGFDKKTIESMPIDEINLLFEQSPWFNSRAEDLGWKERVKIQSIVQKYTTHAISSTINLPKDCKPDLIGNIYMESWKRGLKGNTVYRDGSRGGILVSTDDGNKEPTFVKRPRVIPGKYHTFKCNKKQYSIILGFMNNKPYEIFIVSGLDNLPEVFYENESITGEVIKDTKDWYNFVTDTFIVREITDMENDEKLISLMISAMMSNNTPIVKIIKILNKTKPIAGTFTYKLIKILSQYIPDGEESPDGEKCPACGEKLVFENGCLTCKHGCGWSKC